MIFGLALARHSPALRSSPSSTLAGTQKRHPRRMAQHVHPPQHLRLPSRLPCRRDGCAALPWLLHRALFGLTAIQDRQLNGWYLFWAGLAIALMTKGAACIVLIITALLFAVIERWNLTRLGKSFWLGLLLLLLARPSLASLHVPFVRRQFSNRILRLPCPRARNPSDRRPHHALVVLLLGPSHLGRPLCSSLSLRNRRLFQTEESCVLVHLRPGRHRLLHGRPNSSSPLHRAGLSRAWQCSPPSFWQTGSENFSEEAGQSPKSFWTTATILITSICIASAFLTSGPRRKLHQATVGPDIVYAEKESVSLLRDVFSKPQPVSGPLLVWWEGNARSIATSVFYSRRPVQQVQLEPVPAGVPTDKYLFQPETLKDAVSSGPRIILLDKYLVPRIPSEFAYRQIISGHSMEVGIIDAKLILLF